MNPSSNATVTVASAVRAELARAQRSQDDVALVLQMSQPAVSRRLRGQIPFRVNELGALAALLDIPLTRFFADVQTAIPNGSAA